MSVYTNPAAGAADAAAAYVTAVLDLLGERDPIEILTSTATWCEEAVDGLSARQLVTPEAEGKWSAAGVAQHLADSELVWGYRLRMILAQDRPRLEGYDQDLWAERLDYAAADWSRALEVFAVLRVANLRLVTSAPPADLDRVAVHDERGEESLRHMIRLYAGHDLVHRRQIARVVARVRVA